VFDFYLFSACFVVSATQKRYEVPSIIQNLVYAGRTDYNKMIHESTCEHFLYLRTPEFICGNVLQITKDKVVMVKQTHRFDYLVLCAGVQFHCDLEGPCIISKINAENVEGYSRQLKAAHNVLIVGEGICRCFTSRSFGLCS